MPKNTVTDPITDQEIAFAHLVLSGTMTDRQAAEAAGLNPDTAAYTKAKPRVRDYMIEHRNAVREKLVEKEVEGLRKLNLGRDQVLARLWELANLSHEVTRGSIAGQIKAVSLIIAMEGLIPGRGPSPSQTQPTAPPVEARNLQPLSGSANSSRMETQAMPSFPRKPNPAPTRSPTRSTAPQPTPPLDHNPSTANPFVIPEGRMRVPDATGTSSMLFWTRHLPQAALLYTKRPLWEAPLKPKKSQILSNFINIPALLRDALYPATA